MACQLFFYKCWHIVGEKVIKEVLQVLNSGDMPAGWNNTNIVLIPKVKNPTELKDFKKEKRKTHDKRGRGRKDRYIRGCGQRIYPVALLGSYA